MNFKADKLNKFLIEHGMTARGNEIKGDPLHAIYVTLGSAHGFEYVVQIDDSPIIGVKAVFARNIKPESEGLLPLLNKLSGRRKTHAYLVDSEDFLCASFAVLFEDEAFDPALFLDYCTLIDSYIAEDLPLIFELLGLHLPENFYSGNQTEEEAYSIVGKDASEAFGE